jgi:hypothetical protein
MSVKESAPPHWAEALLRSLLRPSDRDAISGDLLEEYREVRRPSLGRLRADAWYAKHVFSVLWRLLWPCALAMIAFQQSGRYVHLPNVSLLQAPGVSAQDAIICLVAGYWGARRTGLIRTGALLGAATNVIGVAMVFVVLEIGNPEAIVLLFRNPAFIFFPTVFGSIGFAFGAVAGAVGGLVGQSHSRLDVGVRL